MQFEEDEFKDPDEEFLPLEEEDEFLDEDLDIPADGLVDDDDDTDEDDDDDEVAIAAEIEV